MNAHPGDLAAPSAAHFCQRCHSALPAAEAVCAQCDAELSAPAHASKPAGKHHCPSCQLTFSRPAQVLTPANARWYVPQVHRLACPHCGTLLLDTRNPRLSTPQVLALFFLVACGPLLLPAAYAMSGRIAIVVFLLALYAWRRSWGVPDSRRYVRDEA